MARSRKRQLVFSLTRCLVCVFLLAILAGAYFVLPQFIDFPFNTVEGSDTPGLAFHTIDVGQGDCFLVEFPDDKVMMVDAGYDAKHGYNTIKNYLTQRHIDTINWFVCTHPDYDHYAGLPQLVQDFTIEKLYGAPYVTDNKTYNSVANLMIVPEVDKPLAPIIGDDYIVTFVSPYADDYFSSSNDASLMLTIEYYNKIFVLTGDAPTKMETLFMQRATMFTDKLNKQVILKVGHHGSNSSSGTEFLDFIFSEIIGNNCAVISCGKNNTYGHPTAAVLERLREYCLDENILITKDMGDIVLFATASGLSVNEAPVTSYDPHLTYTLVFIGVGITIIILCFTNFRLPKRR